MKARLQQRLQELKAEFQAGQKMLADLQEKQQKLQETLLRISGAIQVLEEQLAEDKDGSDVSPLASKEKPFKA